MTGARRAYYKAGEWEPGMPLYERPTSSAFGNHVRPIFSVIEIELDEECHCTDRASWPSPLLTQQMCDAAPSGS